MSLKFYSVFYKKSLGVNLAFLASCLFIILASTKKGSPMDRTILHCDCNGFFASVEIAKNPALLNVPMAVCGNPENRHGIILAKNELAKAFGIVTAETIWSAQKKCPNLVLVSSSYSDYEWYCRKINDIYEQYSDMVEPFSIDESWLDVTGSFRLFGDGVTIANELRRRIREQLHITISVGVSFNKVFAKMGSEYKKPDATTVITRENFKALLYPLPVSQLFFVGKAAATKLEKMYVRTIGDLAVSDKARINRALGKFGDTIWEYANGLENEPVKLAGTKREIKSVGNGMTFCRDISGLDDVKVGLIHLSDTVATRLREHELKCRGVQLHIKDPNFHSISRQQQLQNPTNLAKEIFDSALAIINSSWNLNSPIRTITLTAINLTEQDFGFQTNIFTKTALLDNEKQEKLENAMDKIRRKYGNNSLEFGTIIKNDIGIHDVKKK